jgi:large subunit ribosomal protein L21
MFLRAVFPEALTIMYAVIETGGKQYRVAPGDVLDVELAETTGKKKQQVKFDRVLLVGGGDGGVQVGSPLVKGAAVSAEVVGEVRAPKVLIFKTKKRKGYRRRGAHRQDLLRVRIREISL